MHAVTVRWEAQQESREKAACRRQHDREANMRAKQWSCDRRRLWVASIAGLRRTVFETTYSTTARVLIAGVALVKAAMNVMWLLDPSLLELAFKYILQDSRLQQNTCRPESDQALLLLALADGFTAFCGAALPGIVIFSRFHLLNNAHLRMVVMLYITTPSTARAQTYITYRRWLKPIRIRKVTEDLGTQSEWESKFTQSQAEHLGDEAVWIRGADPVLLKKRSRQDRRVPRDNLLKMCFVLFRRKHLQMDPDWSSWEKSHPAYLQSRTREHVDALRGNMQKLEFSSLDTSAFLNVRTWMLIDVTMERVRMQHTIAVIAGVLILEFLELFANLWAASPLNDATLRSLWHFLVMGSFLVVLVDAAAAMNETMRNRMMLMVRYWKTRVMKVALRSHNIELPKDDMARRHAAQPPIFLTDVRVQVDSHLRVIQDGLEFLISMIEKQEQPISIFGLDVSYKLENSILALLASAVLSFLWQQFQDQLGQVFGEF
jgi:hypothetical protein